MTFTPKPTGAPIFPGHTAALVLDSPTPLTGTDPFGRERAAALPRVLDGMRRGTDANLVSTVRRLGSRGRRVGIVTSRGRKATVRLMTGDVYSVLGASDLAPGVSGELPAALASAAGGDFVRLARLAEHLGHGGAVSEPGISGALFLATSCAEAPLPWDPAASLTAKLAGLRGAVATLPSSAFSPFSSKLTVAANVLIPACLAWPSTPASPPVTGSAGGVRALVLSGADDLRTPYETTSGVAAGLSGASLVRVPTVGHSVLTNDTVGCGMQAFAAFLNAASIAPCPVTAPRLIPFLPLAPRRLTAVGSLRKRVALTLLGSVATVRDALLDTVSQLSGPSRKTVRFGGLRAGVVALHERTLTLSGVEVLAGLRVTGTLRIGHRLGLTGRVLIAGTTAAPGTLVFSPGRITGRLSGHRVRLTALPMAAPASVFGSDSAQTRAARVIP